MGPAKPGETPGLTCTGLSLACQESAGQVFEWVWKRTDLFFQCKSGMLASYPDPLLIVRRDELEHLRNPPFGWLFLAQIDDYWGDEVSRLLLRYYQNVLLESVFIKPANELLYYCQPFHCPTSVERLGLNCNVEYADANQGIIPALHNFCVRYTESDLDNTFQGLVPSFSVSYFSWTLRNQILQSQKPLPAGNTILTFSKRCNKTQQWILHPRVQEYALMIPTMYKDLYG